MNIPSVFRRHSRAIAVVALLLACAQAQAVQRCRIDGRLVLQASPCPAEAAPPAPVEMLADASEAAPKRSIADALREREADNRARAATREKKIDGASILPARMGAR